MSTLPFSSTLAIPTGIYPANHLLLGHSFCFQLLVHVFRDHSEKHFRLTGLMIYASACRFTESIALSKDGYPVIMIFLARGRISWTRANKSVPSTSRSLMSIIARLYG